MTSSVVGQGVAHLSLRCRGAVLEDDPRVELLYLICEITWTA